MTLNYPENPVGLDAADADRFLEAAGDETNLGKRIDRLSKLLLGCPYSERSLGGGPQLAEEFRVNLNAFDCVTFMEIVLALALSQTSAEFTQTLQLIRYEDGVIDWYRRNHYMVDWARNNEGRGFISNITHGAETVVKTCTLSLIAGLQPKTATFRYFPAERYEEVKARFETGDLILFVSTREGLDVFHTGIMVKHDREALMRHATRKAGAVIEQELVEFMRQNQMSGVMLLRPLCRR